MRYMLAFLLLMCGLVPAFSQSALTWSKKTYAPTGTSVERADFNGDTFPDLLIYGGSTTSIILNKGNGTFDTAHVFTTTRLETVAFLDFNRDGKMDVAGCDGSGNLNILLGNGNGSLTLAQTISDSCSWVATADFNRDKNPDIAVGVPSQSADRTNNQVIVYLGDGRGQVASQVVNSHVDIVGTQNTICNLDGSAQAADFNKDSFDDIAITADCGKAEPLESALIVGNGNGTGHFTFRRDVGFNYVPGKHLRTGGINSFVSDGRHDLYEISDYHLSNGNFGSTLALFGTEDDGAFGFGQMLTAANQDIITAATVADVDSDGLKDIVAIYKTPSDSGDTFAIRFFKRIGNGDYHLTISPLASTVTDMTWGDLNKDGIPDLVLLRPASTDVWLNTTARADKCVNFVPGQGISGCVYGTAGDFHFIGNPRNALPIHAIQVYVDGVKQYQTPDDLLSTHLPLTEGLHRITIKAWDDNGAFGGGNVVFGCPNANDRTVKICSPQNGAVINGATNQNVSLVGSAFSDSTFKATQVYIDGDLTLTTPAQYVSDALSLGKGTHRLTVKGWDVLGPFSSSVTVTVQ